MSTILRGIILGLSITAPIGPTNIEVIRRGIRGGWKSAGAFCMGVIVALVVYLVLVVSGLSYIASSGLFNTLLTVLGIVVLAYLSYSAIKDFISGKEIEPGEEGESNKHFIPGIVLTISNPAILLMWTGILGADFASSQASVNQGIILSVGIVIGVMIFFSILTVLIQVGRKYIRRRYIKYVSLVAGIVLLVFCIWFAYDLVVGII